MTYEICAGKKLWLTKTRTFKAALGANRDGNNGTGYDFEEVESHDMSMPEWLIGGRDSCHVSQLISAFAFGYA